MSLTGLVVTAAGDVVLALSTSVCTSASLPFLSLLVAWALDTRVGEKVGDGEREGWVLSLSVSGDRNRVRENITGKLTTGCEGPGV